MIPKTIHYCWFGPAKKNKKIIACIESWKKVCPDYEIVEWNESNFDVNLNSYTQRCYKEKKYAFLSDYARLWILENYGGIYLDTDVELIRSPSFLLSYNSFYAFENENYINTGLGFGTQPHGQIIQALLDEYDSLMNLESTYIGCPIMNTNVLKRFGLKKNGQLQNLDDNIICPIVWFNPYDIKSEKMNLVPETVGIHWYAASWLPWHKRIRKSIGKLFRKSKSLLNRAYS